MTNHPENIPPITPVHIMRVNFDVGVKITISESN